MGWGEGEQGREGCREGEGGITTTRCQIIKLAMVRISKGGGGGAG